MLRIIKEASVWIVENALGFFKPDPLLGTIAFILSVRPNRTAAYLDDI
jgi:hypothetical protein